MGKILFISLVFILIVYVDASEIFKSKNKKKITVYSSFFFTASVLSLLLLMGVNLPNPMEAVQALIYSIFGKN